MRTGQIEQLNLAIVVVNDTRNASESREFIRGLFRLSFSDGAEQSGLAHTWNEGQMGEEE